jgi:hypothetical protein
MGPVYQFRRVNLAIPLEKLRNYQPTITTTYAIPAGMAQLLLIPSARESLHLTTIGVKKHCRGLFQLSVVAWYGIHEGQVK